MALLRIYWLGLLWFGMVSSCIAQSGSETMTEKKANLSCDIETGECGPTGESGIQEIDMNAPAKVKLLYYTDPICSACWAIEPELKKFKLEYGEYVTVEYRMGGLLPGWEGFADNANGISKPSDVAHHWDEVGAMTGMSIDGDVWLEDPLSSSYPPSIAFKAMQKQGEEQALAFLRTIREMVFLEKKNITKEEVLVEAVGKVGMDVYQFLFDYHLEDVAQSFHAEVKEGRRLGVRGFPTFIFVGENGAGFKISGTSGYENYVLALEKAYGSKPTPKAISLSELELLQKYGYLATKEIAFVLSQDEALTLTNLEALVAKGMVSKEAQKFGVFWRLVQ